MILTTIFALFETICCEYETIFNDSAMLFSTIFNVLQCSELVYFNDLKKNLTIILGRPLRDAGLLKFNQGWPMTLYSEQFW